MTIKHVTPLGHSRWDRLVRKATWWAWETKLFDARIFDRLDPAGRLLTAICWTAGHEAIGDQCGNPAHDFCFRCHKSMPGQTAVNGWPDPDDDCPYCADPQCATPANCGAELDQPPLDGDPL